jgi:hypothetical protein
VAPAAQPYPLGQPSRFDPRYASYTAEDHAAQQARLQQIIAERLAEQRQLAQHDVMQNLEQLWQQRTGVPSQVLVMGQLQQNQGGLTTREKWIIGAGIGAAVLGGYLYAKKVPSSMPGRILKAIVGK